MTHYEAHNFRPPEAAASLYPGEVMHARLKPFVNRFVYRVFALLIDLDRLDVASRAARLFSVGRFNLASFHEADHGPGDGSSLSAHVRGLLARAGQDPEGGRVLLLCYPRILGYVFNPLSVYWRYDDAGALTAVVYEVTNTFGERHGYVAPVKDGELTESGLRQERDKLFYVSPFLETAMRYAFRIRPPTDSVRLRILESDAEGPILSATFTGERRALTDGALLRLCGAMPLMTLKVFAGIHWEALKLWIKGARLVDHDPPPSPASHDTPGPIRHGRGTRRPEDHPKDRAVAPTIRETTAP